MGAMKILRASPYQEKLILSAPLTKKQRSELALERQRLLELESKRTRRKALDKAIKRQEQEAR